MLQGYLKQQCIDSSGLIHWNKRYFILSNTGDLEVKDASESSILIDIVDISSASYVKEWSVSSLSGGGGFDLMFSDGKMWSFLAEDSVSCNRWVVAMNECLKSRGKSSISSTVRVSDSPFAARSSIDKSPIRGHMQMQDLSTALDSESLSRYREEILKLRRELDSQAKKHEDELSLSLERERKNIQSFREMMESRIQLVSRENTNFYESSIETLKQQHQKDILALHRELENERLKMSVSTNESRRQQSEVMQQVDQGKLEVEKLRMMLQKLEHEKESMDREYHHTITKLNNDKIEMNIAHDKSIQAILQEKNDFIDKLKLESYEKSNEMISNYNQKIENMELTLRESIRLEFERKYMQDMKEVNAKMMKDMDVLRLENEKTSKLEADKLQQHLVIEKKKHIDDILELEKQHQSRINHSESQYQELLQKYQQERERAALYHNENVQVVDKLRTLASSHIEVVEEHKREILKLEDKVHDQTNQVNSWKTKEREAREKLLKMMDESHLLRAELNEYKRQASEGFVQAQYWKKIVEDNDYDKYGLETSLQIMKDELNMMCLEKGRLEDENSAIRESLHKANRYVYGINMSPSSSMHLDPAISFSSVNSSHKKKSKANK